MAIWSDMPEEATLVAAIIDVREYPEFTRVHIQDAQLVPLGLVADASKTCDKSNPLLLVCKSGRRAEEACQTLAGNGFKSLTALLGRMDAWSSAGKPVAKESYQTGPMERQVRTAAGGLVMTTVALEVFTSRSFLIGTALVGPGLAFAGISNTWMMASVFGLMRWNRKRA
jgi:rhodanese-related sulfurtransferase